MRTCADGVVQSVNNQKWWASFVTYNGPVGAEYVANCVDSGAVFDTEDEALDGQIRALNVLKATGRWPNMCEKF